MARLTIFDDGEEAANLPREIELENGETVIGRGEGAGLVLDNPTVSRQHSAINATSQGFVLVDLESANGTWVNGKRIERYLLRDGDEIRMGRVKILFADPPDPQATVLVDMAKVRLEEEAQSQAEVPNPPVAPPIKRPVPSPPADPRPEPVPAAEPVKRPDPPQVAQPPEPPLPQSPPDSGPSLSGDRPLIREAPAREPRPAPPPPAARPRSSARQPRRRSSGVQNYAGFWIRVAAYLIDVIILAVVVGGLSVGLLMVAGMLRAQIQSIDLLMLPIQFVISLVLPAAYVIGFWTKSGATPGKKAVGIKIVSADGGGIGAGTAMIRLLGYFVSSFIFCIGYIMIAFSDRKQGLHDVIAKTLVVRR